jgi:hypothetical protein
MKPAGAVLWISLFCGSGPVISQDLSAAVGTYCVPCHNGRLAEAKIALDSLDSGRPWTQPDLWERVLRQLRARTMPPTENPRPDPQTYGALVSELASALDHGDARGDPQKPVAAALPVTDLELADRLAKLLWNSAPDAALLDVARKDRLHVPAVLDAQVRRMLADAKIAGLVDGFFDEWLGLNQLAAMPADAAAFPEFDSQLRQVMQRETELFVASQLREDRPAMELWTADYTFLNDRLARHYGIPDVSGPEFRRVTLQGSERAGLLGQGSFLTATSVLTRHAAVDAPSTSPAARGKWIRTHFLGVSVPHPIPNIPPLQKGILLSAQLRTLPDPSCTACHSNFFPMGYALENFDPLGRWRTEAESESGNASIDASGTMVDGTEFTGLAELRHVLLERRDAFLTTITERLLAYAVAGKAGIFEPTPAKRMPAVRAVVREAERKNFTWSALFAAVADTALFQAK